MFEKLVPNFRTLTADDLGIGVQAKAAMGHASSAPDAPEIPPEDPRIQEIVRLARIYGGVILSGPPGTSKTYFAAAAAEFIAQGDEARYRYVQFHASYQYEDFMLGFVPSKTGFRFKPGPFLQLAIAAAEDPDNAYVLIVDELSRADVGRVFGEALTYIERNKRELSFDIASGVRIRVPSNLILIATMNPFDRGVDEVDAAFERRFAKVSMDPDADLLEEILTANGVDEPLKVRLLAWFGSINGYARKNPAAAVGHAYFWSATDAASLRDIWEYQLKYLVERAFRRDQNTHSELEARWKRIFHEDDETTAQPENR